MIQYQKRNELVVRPESTYGGEVPRHFFNGDNMDNRQTAIEALLSELQNLKQEGTPMDVPDFGDAPVDW